MERYDGFSSTSKRPIICIKCGEEISDATLTWYSEAGGYVCDACAEKEKIRRRWEEYCKRENGGLAVGITDPGYPPLHKKEEDVRYKLTGANLTYLKDKCRFERLDAEGFPEDVTDMVMELIIDVETGKTTVKLENTGNTEWRIPEDVQMVYKT